jgi:8-oxo-dGTP diphosphatase
VPFPYPRALADEWIASTWAQIAAGKAWHLAVAGADNDALLGCAGLSLDRRGGRRAELGYWIGRPHWGKGLGPEAAGRLARWALDGLGVSAVHASALRDNARSVAVLRRLGFRDAGEGAQVFLSRGGGAMPVLLFEAGRADLDAAAAAAKPSPAPEPAPAAAAAVLLVVACALVDPDGRVLLARRPEGKPMAGLWEFPGGKAHPGETPEAALIRELREELGICVEASCLAPFTFASHPLGEGRHLLMPLFLCRKWDGAVRAREGQALAWVRPQRLRDYAMPPADKPLVAMLRDFL